MASNDKVTTNDPVLDAPVWGEVGWTAPKILAGNSTEKAAVQLRAYFAPLGGGLCGSHSGAEFTELGGGGDTPEVADTVTAEDVFAVSTLSVSIPPTHALQLLGRGVTKEGLDTTREWRDKLGHRRALKSKNVPSLDEAPIDAAAVRTALADIPSNLAIADVPAADIDDLLEHVDVLWREIRRRGMAKQKKSTGQVVTSKLLARKRPHLLPVLDSVVASQLSHKRKKRTDFNRSMWRVMSDTELALPAHLSDIRERAFRATEDERIRRLSDLRVFDIVVWMDGKTQSK